MQRLIGTSELLAVARFPGHHAPEGKVDTSRNDEAFDATSLPSPSEYNTIDPYAQSMIGGRNPGQPNAAMGDMGARQQRPSLGKDATDPMSLRLPKRKDPPANI